MSHDLGTLNHFWQYTRAMPSLQMPSQSVNELPPSLISITTNALSPSMDAGDRKRRIILIYLVILIIFYVQYERQKRRRQVRYRPAISYLHRNFNFYEWDDERFRRSFRFNKDEIPRLARALRLSEIRWRQRIQPDQETALCLVLYRLSWPHRYSDLTQVFHRSPTWLSTVFNDVCTFLWRQWHELVAWHPMLNNYKRLRRYAKSVKKALGNEGPLTFWGFIDGTFRSICRPLNEQNVYYSGYKKQHGIKYQGIITPDGIMTLQGPFEGRINDWAMYQKTDIEARIREVNIPTFLVFWSLN